VTFRVPRRLLFVVLLLLLTGGSVGAFVFMGGGSSRPAQSAASRPEAASPPAGSAAKFDYLSAQRSNSCGLQAPALRSYRKSAHLQGSCCFPMDPQSYRAQVEGLRRYSAISEIASDPYDISVSLAQRLLRYKERIHLNSGQRTIYRRAMRMSQEKGPCCCRCWRWDAFEGMSRYLIARRHWTAGQLARLIGLVDGCGGPQEVGPGSA
jgi:hypothetical protein